MPEHGRKTCPRCSGSGAFVDEARCCVCHGSGTLAADTPPPSLKVGQAEFLERIDREGASTFTERDWALALPLRDKGLTGMQPHPFWRFVPLVAPFKQQMGLTWLGRRALDEARNAARLR